MKKKMLILSILSLIFLSLAYVLVFSPNGKIILASFHMKEIDSKVFVDSKMSEDDTEKILKELESSYKIISSYFEGIESSPTILFIASDEMVKKYGDVSGATYDTLFGDYILSGPRGGSTEIISHELVHSELRSRISIKELPTWFDEGLATYIDGRFQSEISQWKIEQKKSEEVYDWTTQEIFRDTNEPILDRYKLAAYEVSQWYEENGNKGLIQLFSRLKEGNDFLPSYKDYLN